MWACRQLADLSLLTERKTLKGAPDYKYVTPPE